VLGYLVTCLKNDVHFVFPKTFLSFRVRVWVKVTVRVEFRFKVIGNIVIGLELSEIRLKNVFGQTSIQASVLDPRDRAVNDSLKSGPT